LVGDTLTLISPSGIESAITQLSLPSSKRFIISGIFSSSNNEYDDQYFLHFLYKIIGYITIQDRIKSINIDNSTSKNLENKTDTSIALTLFGFQR
jgi:ABC-type lipoprotein release transport system permease subunit